MSQKNTRIIHLAVGLILSVMLTLSGILLICACVSVYELGGRPFTAENISAAFSRISVPIFITVALSLAAIVLRIVFPMQKKSGKRKIRACDVLAVLEEKLAASNSSAALDSYLSRNALTRRILRIGYALLYPTLCLPSAVYILNFENYTLALEDSVIAAATWLAPIAVLCIAAAVGYSYLDDALTWQRVTAIKEHLEATGAIIPGRPVKDVQTALANAATRERTGRGIIAARVSVLVLAIVLISLGIINGGADDVLYKAINICTECIGLG